MVKTRQRRVFGRVRVETPSGDMVIEMGQHGITLRRVYSRYAAYISFDELIAGVETPLLSRKNGNGTT